MGSIRLTRKSIPKKYRPSKKDLRQAKKIHHRRSEKAQEVDEAMLSKLTKSSDVYVTDPSRWDMFGVDVPKKVRLSVLDELL